MDTLIIHPEPPTEIKALAKELIALADNPTQVEYVMWPEPGFRVPEDLFGRFVAGRKVAQAPVVEEPVPTTDEPKPVKRSPGRPRKEGQQ